MIDERDVRNAMHIQYYGYDFVRIYDFEEDYKALHLEVDVIRIEKKFLGLWRKKHREQKTIFFQDKILVREFFDGTVISYQLEIAIDDYNGIVYWKLLGKETMRSSWYERYYQYTTGGNRNRYNSNSQQSSKSELQRHLDFLNIGNNAYSKASLKAHYRKLSKQYHPDITGGDSEMMVKINVAYDYIMKTLE